MRSVKKSKKPCARNENAQWEYHYNSPLNENYPARKRRRKLGWGRELVLVIGNCWVKHRRRRVLLINLGRYRRRVLLQRGEAGLLGGAAMPAVVLITVN